MKEVAIHQIHLTTNFVNEIGTTWFIWLFMMTLVWLIINKTLFYKMYASFSFKSGITTTLLLKLSGTWVVTVQGVVQLNLTPEFQVFHVLFERCHTKNRQISSKLHIKKFNFLRKLSWTTLYSFHWHLAPPSSLSAAALLPPLHVLLLLHLWLHLHHLHILDATFSLMAWQD